TLFGLILLLPPYVEYAAYVMAENLTEFMLVGGFVALVAWFLRRGTTWLIASWVAFAYSGLSRPTYQIVAFAVTACLLVMPVLFRWVPFTWREMIKPSIVLVGTTLIIIGGYSYINYRNFGYLGTTPLLGFSLSTRTLRVIERLPDEYSAIRKILLQ